MTLTHKSRPAPRSYRVIELVFADCHHAATSTGIRRPNAARGRLFQAQRGRGLQSKRLFSLARRGFEDGMERVCAITTLA